MSLRRRRRRSAFAQRKNGSQWIKWGAIGLIAVGAFVFLVRHADTSAPEPSETRIDVPVEITAPN